MNILLMLLPISLVLLGLAIAAFAWAVRKGQFDDLDTPALDILDEVGADNAFVQYDIYHAQRMEGELAATLQKHLARIGHVQLADNPGRNEPGTGEIHYPFLFAHLDRIGYSGWVGCEYKPATSTEAGLGWRSALVN